MKKEQIVYEDPLLLVKYVFDKPHPNKSGDTRIEFESKCANKPMIFVPCWNHYMESNGLYMMCLGHVSLEDRKVSNSDHEDEQEEGSAKREVCLTKKGTRIQIVPGPRGIDIEPREFFVDDVDLVGPLEMCRKWYLNDMFCSQEDDEKACTWPSLCVIL